MVSKELKRIQCVRLRNGGTFSSFTEWGREKAEREARRTTLAVKAKNACRTENEKRGEALNSKGFKVGDRVTDGRVRGKIASIDRVRNVVLVDTGVRKVNISPLVLEYQ